MVDLRGGCRSVAERARFDQDVLSEEVAVAELDVIVAEGGVVEPRSLFQNDNSVPRPGQHPSSHTAAGTRPDDENVALGERHASRPLKWPGHLLPGPALSGRRPTGVDERRPAEAEHLPVDPVGVAAVDGITEARLCHVVEEGEEERL